MIIVLPTYNNLSSNDSYDYDLAIRLTNNYHNELVNDLMPAVEGRFSAFADNTTREGFRASRNHRAFGGFSMGSVTTWRTFQYCLEYFRYFCPSSGDLTDDGGFMANIVKRCGYKPSNFFILSATGTNDFDYYAFSNQIKAMREQTDVFRFADHEAEGNLFFRVAQGGMHGETYQNIYAYNNLMWLWKEN